MSDKQKIVVISGASSGLGLEIAKLLSKKGMFCILLARSKDKLDIIVNEIKSRGHQAVAIPVDLGDEAQTLKVSQQILNEYGTPNVLVNNAGIGVWREIESTDAQENKENLALPYFAAFNLTHNFIPAMLKNGTGQIINVTSPAAYFSFPGAVSYSVARWAMRGFSESLYADLYKTPVKVSLFCPGKIDSEYFNNNPGSEERIPTIDKLIPVLTPEKAASGIWSLIQSPKKVLFLPWQLALFKAFDQFVPGMVNFLTINTGWQRPKK